MAKLLFSALLLAASISQAQIEILECGLPSFMEEEGAIIELPGQKTLAEGVELDNLQKQQVVIAARELLSAYGERVEVNSTTEAIRLLVDWGMDVYIENFRVAGSRQVFTQVKGYPGDNPMGVIFKLGSRTITAYNGDSSITCAE